MTSAVNLITPRPSGANLLALTLQIGQPHGERYRTLRSAVCNPRIALGYTLRSPLLPSLQSLGGAGIPLIDTGLQIAPESSVRHNDRQCAETFFKDSAIIVKV